MFLRKNQVYEFIPDRLPEIPIKKFEKVSGEAFFIDENLLVFFFFFHLVQFLVQHWNIISFDMFKKFEFNVELFLQVYPIVGFPDMEICNASKEAIVEHLNKYTSVSRILRQVSKISKDRLLLE